MPLDVLLGFVIAALISITGVGAGTMTAPLLILFLDVPVATAVSTALLFSALVKLLVVPVQVLRRRVVWSTLAVMLLTGVPGVILGSIALSHASHLSIDRFWIYLTLGSVIAFSSAWHIFRHFRPAPEGRRQPRPAWLAAAMLPIGAEVGFSSSGAGALGSIALLSLTPLDAAQVVGTDLAFGFCVSLIAGGVHLLGGGLEPGLLGKLILGGVLGAPAGTLLAPRIPARTMRLMLSLCLLAIGFELCWRAGSMALT
jgi:uncharacterized protein